MVIIKKIVKLGYDLGCVFTWDKSFKHNCILGNYWLNRCGLHVFRIVLAQCLFRFRLLLLSPLVAKQDRRNFIKDGYLLKPNFLPQQDFDLLRQELLGYNGEIREIVEGTTLTQRAFMTAEARKELPQMSAFANHRLLNKLIRFCSSKNRPPLFYIENLCNKANVTPRPDPQRDLHADTFHPCVKAWLFIDDVSDDNGSHIYVPGSQRLSWSRLRWEYKQSLEACKQGEERQKGRYWDGSFRVSPEDLSAMGFVTKKISVPANTLLIGNVYGFHCRGEAKQKSNRMTIWMQARDNPFNPFFTPLPAPAAKVFEWVWGVTLKHEDKAKTASGEQRNIIGRFKRY